MTKKENFVQVVKFALISASAGLIQIGSFALLERIFSKWKYMYLYLPSLILSVIWNFTINRKYTFKSANNVPVAMLKVALFYVVFTPFTTWVGQKFDNAGVNKYIIEICTMGFNLVTEYLYDRFIVFRGSMNTRDDKKEAKETDEEIKNTTEAE